MTLAKAVSNLDVLETSLGRLLTHLKDLETCDVEDANERRSLAFAAIERSIDSLDDPLEHSLVDGFADRFDGVFHLISKTSKYQVQFNTVDLTEKSA